MKKLLSVLLAAVMIFGTIALGISNVDWADFAVKASAENVTSGTCGENLTWVYDDFSKTLTISGTGEMYDYEEDSYQWEYTMEKVVIEEGVTSIGDYAFYSYGHLESVTIPDSVTSIGELAFFWCDKITSITIPAGVKTIGDSAFGWCRGLANVTIPDNVEVLEDGAFIYCTGLESITIGKGVTSIGTSAFSGCWSLKNITVSSENQSYSSDNQGVLFNKDKTLLIYYPQGSQKTSYEIPDGTKYIEEFAFSECGKLESITVPVSIETIGASAFNECNALTDVYYAGTEEEWNAITIVGGVNDTLLEATIHYNYGSEDSSLTITSYEQGDIVEFGWYPQSEVTDSEIIAVLNADDGEWISYGYYSGTGSWYDGKMSAGDYMRYKDVMYGSDKYRGVVFDSYRPYWTGEELTTNSNTIQAKNGYYSGTIYWFKYEPIKWRVLDPDTGMVMAETILDSQVYNNYILYYWGDSSKTYYCCDYVNSSIRKWLNEDFYNTAFSAEQQDIIVYTALDNSAYDGEYVNSAFDSENTNDKVYLLSYDEVINADYGFNTLFYKSDISRQAQGSDYAKCQGLSVSDVADYAGNSYWLLRTPGGDGAYSTCDVEYNGGVNYYNYSAYTMKGVRPALNFDLDSEIFQSDVSELVPVKPSTPHTHSYSSALTKEPGCETAGIITYSCSCGDSYTKAVEAKGHSFGDWQVEKEATANESGTKVRTCSECGTTEEESFEMPFIERFLYYIRRGFELTFGSLGKIIDYITMIIESIKIS